MLSGMRVHYLLFAVLYEGLTIIILTKNKYILIEWILSLLKKINGF